MKFITVIYNDNCKFILDIINKIQNPDLIEYFNIDDYRQKKKAIPIMTRHGTNLVPLIVFQDENLKEISAIWSEQNPDWEQEIINNLNQTNG